MRLDELAQELETLASQIDGLRAIATSATSVQVRHHRDGVALTPRQIVTLLHCLERIAQELRVLALEEP